MEEFKPNSHRNKEEKETERKKVQKVVTGKVKTKKKSSGRKLADVLLTEDITSVKSHILSDVVVPAIKDMLYDAVTSGLSMILGGDGRGVSNKRSSTNSRDSYSQYYKQSKNTPSGSTRTKGGQYNYDDVILDSRMEAEEVLDVMQGLIEEYGMVSLADMYDAVGMTSNYTDNKYGWYDLNTASISGNRGSGYFIKLPRITLLD